MEPNIVDLFQKFQHTISSDEAEIIIATLEEKLGIGTGATGASSGEVAVARILCDSFNEKVTVFDVGANIGQYCQIICDELEGEVPFEVHSFEPSKDSFEAFKSAIGDRANIFAHNFGLSDKIQSATLFMDQATSGLASLTPRRLQHFGIDHSKFQETVELRTLDDYCAEMNIDQIHLLKIDVEGHELDVIKGGKRLFSEGAINMVQFEFGGTNIDTRTFFQDYYYFFTESDYVLYRILPDGSLYRIHNYNESYEKFRTSNYIAAPRTDFLLSPV